MTLDAVSDALAADGLLLRGGFHVEPADGLGEARTLLLIGNAGPAMWEKFRPHDDGRPHPLDRWTRAIVDGIAARYGLRALYPFDRSPNGGHYPFQRWAIRAEGLKPSPLGLLVHPVYGLWHAYRAALLSDEALGLPERAAPVHPCDACPDKPCLRACPVGAFDGRAYDVPACAAHLAGGAEPRCTPIGCRARDACPVGRDPGRDWRYSLDQVRFHMEAFARSVCG